MKYKLNSTRQIDWFRYPTTKVTGEEFQKIWEDWQQKDYTMLPHYTCSTAKGYGHYFQLQDCYCSIGDDGIYKYKVVAEQDKIEPFNAFMAMTNQFHQMENVNFSKAFGTVRECHYYLRACVPTQVSWSTFNPNFYGKVAPHCYKMDISSAFPYEGTKTLPTWVGHKEMSGRVAPTEDYPFAFYSDGTFAIWNEFDSTEFFTTPYYISKEEKELRDNKTAKDFYYSSLPDASHTVLCKASQYTLKNVFEYFYERKHTDELAKAIMNYSIGMCWLKIRPSFLHLAAVIIGRTVHRVIQTAYKLLDCGDSPLLIATDAIAWSGKPHPEWWTAKSNKKLGDFVVEVVDGEMIVVTSHKYQIKYGDKVITRWSGVKKEQSQNMIFGEVLNDGI